LRRRFLLGAAAATGARAIATAHTADDQLETVLFRLARGAGLRGLSGMRPRAGRWVKPLLEATREDIEHDLGRAGFAWCEDTSNSSREPVRNRIRHDVVPALAAATGRTRSALARRAIRAASEVRAAENTLARRLRARLWQNCRIEGGVLRLASGGWAPYPSPVRRMALRAFWNRFGDSSEGLTHRHLDALVKLTKRGGAKSEVRLPGGWRAVRLGTEIHWHAGPGAKQAGAEGKSPETARLETHGGPTRS